MAPIKFEEDIRDTLEKRTIEPATKSWDTLSHRLDSEEKKNNKNRFWWLAIAASFVGMLLIYNMFLNTNNENLPTQNVVEIDTEVIENKTENTQTKDENIIVEVKERVESKEVKYLDKKRQQKKNYLVVSKFTKEEVITIEKTELKTPQEEVLYANLEKENTIKPETKTITKNLDNEVDQLLKSAQNKAVTATINTLILDHNRLLNEVEDDLERSFRDKLLMVVKGGIDTAKDVVVERYNDNQVEQ